MSLRALSDNDLPLILEWRNTPAVRANMYSPHEISKDEHYAWFERQRSNRTARWYLYSTSQGKPAGVVYFTDIDERNRTAFWGFYTNPQTPSGTGTKLALEAMDEAFCKQQFHKLSSEVIGHNSKSIRLHKRMGFSQEGLFRSHHLSHGEYSDVLRFGMLSTEWQTNRLSVESHIASFKSE